MLQRHEIPNFTKEQVEQHVMDALEIAAAAQLTGEDRAALLPTILERLSNKQVMLEQVPDVPDLRALRPQG